MADDLKPCPFCGPGPTVNLVMQNNPEGGWLYEVVCQGCSTTMPCDDSETDAIADWNRRAVAPAQCSRMSDQELRKLWREAGGEFYGPRVETGSMPEAKLLPFLRVLAAARTPAASERPCGSASTCACEAAGKVTCQSVSAASAGPFNSEMPSSLNDACRRLDLAQERVSQLEAQVEELKARLKPFADAARNFTSAIAPDGIDDGISVVATMHGGRYEAVLSTADFSNASRALSSTMLGSEVKS